MSGTLFVVATPIGNLEDISVRALAVLRRVALVAAEDTRRTARLLQRYEIATPATSLHEHNERSKAETIVARLLRGDDVALVSDAGTPTVSDPGAQLVRAALRAGLRVEPIPGPSAVLAALVASGLPGETFTFLGFPPTKAKDRAAWFDELRLAGRTVIFFEAPHRIAATLDDLLRVIGDRNIAVARELTKAHEELVRGPISDVQSRLGTPRGEFTVVVEIGRTIETTPPMQIRDKDVLYEFGQIIENKLASRRGAIGVLARRYGRAPNEIYSAVERAKKLVKQQKAN